MTGDQDKVERGSTGQLGRQPGKHLSAAKLRHRPLSNVAVLPLALMSLAPAVQVINPEINPHLVVADRFDRHPTTLPGQDKEKVVGGPEPLVAVPEFVRTATKFDCHVSDSSNHGASRVEKAFWLNLSAGASAWNSRC